MKPCSKCGGTGKVIDDVKTGLELKAMRGDLTASEVAKAMKVSKGYLCDLEHGRRRWTVELIYDYHHAVRGLL